MSYLETHIKIIIPAVSTSMAGLHLSLPMVCEHTENVAGGEGATPLTFLHLTNRFLLLDTFSHTHTTNPTFKFKLITEDIIRQLDQNENSNLFVFALPDKGKSPSCKCLPACLNFHDDKNDKANEKHIIPS